MRSKKPYTAIVKLIHQVEKLDDKLVQPIYVLLEDVGGITHDYRNNQVVDDKLLALGKANAELSSFLEILDDSTAIDQDSYLVIYAHFLLKDQLGKLATYIEVTNLSESSLLSQNVRTLSHSLSFFALAYYLILAKPNWKGFIQEFNGENWTEITTLQEVIPVAGLSIDEISNWIEIVVTKQEKDGALTTIADSIKEWTLRYSDIDSLGQALPDFVGNDHLRKFLSPVISGLRERQHLDFRQYWLKLKEFATSSTTADILFAIGRLELNSQTERDDFLLILMENFENGNISKSSLINLSTTFDFFNDEIDGIITSVLDGELEDKIPYEIIWYLDKANKGSKWYNETCHVVFAITENKYTYVLDSLLVKISEANPELACTLLELRMQLTCGVNPLERAIKLIALQEREMFQTLILKWLNSDDSRLHLALRQLATIGDLDSDLFSIDKEVLAPLSLPDKLYVACKIVGYVYGREMLQRLFISLVKSVDIDHETFEMHIRALLKDYLIYNYRSTLNLLKSEVENVNLSQFAKRVFNDAIDVYEKYFEAFRELTAKKELTPPKRLAQLKRFYSTKHFQGLRERSEQKGMFNELFGEPILLNSNSWAIRRESEPKHVVTELGQVEVSMEYPSGEILDPHFQEYMRRTYQKIGKHEIDLN